jgi:DNA-binding transcriptional regulator YiaG
MPNIAKVLREEISRISRHEAKAAVTPIRKPAIRLRKDVANLKARLALLEKANKELQAAMAKIQAAQPEPVPESVDKGWISGNGVRTLRKRLGLSQKEFAKLVGVSSKAVVLWEGRPGMLKFRGATKAAVFAVRGIGKAEARQRLEEMGKKAVKATKKAKRRRK